MLNGITHCYDICFLAFCLVIALLMPEINVPFNFAK